MREKNGRSEWNKMWARLVCKLSGHVSDPQQICYVAFNRKRLVMPGLAVNHHIDGVFPFLPFVSKYKTLTCSSTTDLLEAWGCSRDLLPSRVGGGVGGGRRARGLRACLGGPRCRPDAASASLRRSPLPRRPRPAPGQRRPGAPRSNRRTAAPLGLFHAGAVCGEAGEGR